MMNSKQDLTSLADEITTLSGHLDEQTKEARSIPKRCVHQSLKLR